MIILQGVELKAPIKPIEGIQEIQIFPRGKVYIDKYKKDLIFDDEIFNQMIEAFNSEDLSRPFVDKNHDFKESYAPIMALRIKEDGLYGDIKLNAKGIELIKNEVYMYISPAIDDVVDNKGNLHKNVLIAVTLTNTPALRKQQSLQEQIKLSGITDEVILCEFTKPQKTNGGKTMKVLANYIGLVEDASEAKILEAVRNKITTLETEKAEVEKKLEIAENDKETALKELEAVNEKQKAIELEAFTKEKDAYFDKASKEGRVPIKELEMWKEKYDNDKEFVVKLLDMRPVIDSTQKTLTSPGGATKLETEDREMMESAGLDPYDPKDVKKYKDYVLEGEKKNG